MVPGIPLIYAGQEIGEERKPSLFEKGELNSAEITYNVISQNLTTCNMPDPELLIRTSGESRISNFLLWQIAYAELHFTNVLWPDFRREDLYKAIVDYQKRERRFGKISEQVINNI